MRQFKVREGKHAIRMPNGKVKSFKAGEVVHSEDDLCAKFVHKFEEVFDVPQGKSSVDRALAMREAAALTEAAKKRAKEEEDLPPEPEDADGEEEKVEEDGTALDESPPDYGTDVTKKFPGFASIGLQVFYDGEDYSVVKDGERVCQEKDKNDVADWFRKFKKSTK